MIRVDAPLGRVLHSADFDRLMQSPARKRSAHFAVHHVMAWPHAQRPPATQKVADNLSTAHQPSCPDSVDECVQAARPGERWLGCMVPKRHAKRAVTRNLIKRQMRTAAQRHAQQLLPGLWLLRQHRPFDPRVFVSAASSALREAARVELEALLSSLGAPAPACKP